MTVLSRIEQTIFFIASSKIQQCSTYILCIADEDSCAECDEVLTGLEKIDDETDALDITFVKVYGSSYLDM